MQPGDIYNTVQVDASAERLRNLNYFSKVDTIAEPTQVPNRKDLAIDVEEQQTGTVTFGAGFSSVDSLIGFVELKQANFDLFNWPSFTGGGQHLNILMQVGFVPAGLRPLLRRAVVSGSEIVVRLRRLSP